MTTKAHDFIAPFNGSSVTRTLLRTGAYFFALGVYITFLTALYVMAVGHNMRIEDIWCIPTFVAVPAVFIAVTMYSSQHILESRGLSWRYTEIAGGYAAWVILNALFMAAYLNAPTTVALISCALGIALSLARLQIWRRFFGIVKPFGAAAVLILTPSVAAGQALQSASTLPLSPVRVERPLD